MPLRDYQLSLIHQLRSSFKSYNRILTVLPTGAGKTEIFCEIASRIRSNGKSVQVLVHRRELLQQTPDPSVTTIQSWKPDKTDIIIVDEAHHVCAKTWLEKLSNCRCILGFTATPQRLDGSGLNVLFDNMVIGLNTRELIKKGWLSTYKVFSPPGGPNVKSVHLKHGDYNRKELTQAVCEPGVVAAAVKNWQHFAEGRQTIAFCASLAHMNLIAKKLRKAGISCDTVDGRLPKTKRDSVIQRFRSGEIKILLSVDLISEGFDVPTCDCVLLLRPTRSLCLHLQQVGRALRPSNQHAVILDAAGNSERHGLPDDDRYWSLEGVTKQKTNTRIAIRNCPNCYAAHKPHLKVCPYCGFIHSVESRIPSEKDILLEEIDQKSAHKIKSFEYRQMLKRQVDQARTEAELQHIAHQRGYKPGWVYKVLQARLEAKSKAQSNF